MNNRGSVDFTITTYRKLLQALKMAGYGFQRFSDFLESPRLRFVVLRHDVDRRPENAFRIAQMESDLNICTSYYFRSVKESFDEEIIKKIASFGHEIGCHYEDVVIASKNLKAKSEKDMEQLIALSYDSFCENLSKFRKIVPIKTICMHGSPLSKYDNRLLWQKYNYRELGIIGEPYFDIDFNEVLYLTDASRTWQDTKSNIRDRVNTKFEFHFKNTQEIIQSVIEHKLPDKIMINVHPHNWSETKLQWLKTYLWQGFKNKVKRFYFYRYNSNSK